MIPLQSPYTFPLKIVSTVSHKSTALDPNGDPTRGALLVATVVLITKEIDVIHIG